jgi:hypothetical protein
MKEKVETAPHRCRQDYGCCTAGKRRRRRPLHTTAGRTVAATLQEREEGGDRSTPLQAGLFGVGVGLQERKEGGVETAGLLGYCLLSYPSTFAVGRPGKVAMTVASCLEGYLISPQVTGLSFFVRKAKLADFSLARRADGCFSIK